jgi:hypothetical protein
MRPISTSALAIQRGEARAPSRVSVVLATAAPNPDGGSPADRRQVKRTPNPRRTGPGGNADLFFGLQVGKVTIHGPHGTRDCPGRPHPAVRWSVRRGSCLAVPP